MNKRFMKADLIRVWLIAMVLLMSGIQLVNAQQFQMTLGGTSDDVLFSACPSFRYGKTVNVGYTEGYGATGRDVVFMESDTSGVIWAYRMGGTGDDEALWVSENPSDSTYIAMGYTTNGATGKDILIWKFDTLGNIIWQKTIQSAGDEVVQDGNEWIVDRGTGDETLYVFTGYFNGALSYGQNDIFYLVLDKDGNEQFMSKLGSTADDVASGIATDKMAYEDRLLISGHSNEKGTYDIWGIELDVHGNMVFANRYSGAGDDISTDVYGTWTKYCTGGVCDTSQIQRIVGYTNSLGTGDLDGFMVYYNPLAGITNVQRYGQDGTDEAVFKVSDLGGTGIAFPGYFENPVTGDKEGLQIFADVTGNNEGMNGVVSCPTDEIFYDFAMIQSNPWNQQPVAVGHTTMGKGGTDFLMARSSAVWGFPSGCLDQQPTFPIVFGGAPSFARTEYTDSISMTTLTGSFNFISTVFTTNAIAIEDSNLCNGGSTACGLSVNWTQDSIVTCDTAFELEVLGSCIDSIRWTRDNSTISTGSMNVEAKSSGYYKVKVYKPNCTLEDSIYLQIKFPSFVQMTSKNVCLGDSTEFQAYGETGNYNWDFGDPLSGADNDGSGMIAKHVFSTTGTYTVKLIPKTGCSLVDTLYETITISNAPTFELTDTALCNGDNITLDVTTPGATYVWQDASTGPTMNVTAAGQYSVIANVSGCQKQDTANVSFNPAPIDNLPTDTSGCIGDSVQLMAGNNGATFLWSTAETTPDIFVKTAGSYSVKISIGFCSLDDTVQVSFTTAPSVDLGNDTTLCAGDSLELNAANPGATYQWQDGSVNVDFTVKSAGLYWALVSVGTCEDRDSIQVDYSLMPVSNLPGAISGCVGGTVQLDAGNNALPNVSYAWNNGSNTQLINVFNDSLYIVDISNGACLLKDSVNVSFLPAPEIDLGNDTTLCQGDSVILDATYTGASYQWNTGSNGAMITVKNSGTYIANVDLGGCTDADTLEVAFDQKPGEMLPDTLTGCDEVPEVLDATTSVTGTTYEWSQGSTNSSVTVTNSGTYSVILRNGVCTGYDTTFVIYYTSPVVTLGNDTLVCDGEEVLLDAGNSTATHTWLGDGNGNGQIYTVKAAGTYIAEVEEHNCFGYDTIDVSYVAYPTDVLPDSMNFCLGDTAGLDVSGSGAGHLEWSTGEVDQNLIMVTAEGMYSVDLFNQQCGTEDSTYVLFTEVPKQEPKDTTICEGMSVTLVSNLDNGFSVQWMISGDSIVVSTDSSLDASVQGIYIMVLSNQNCIAEDSVVVLVNELPEIDLTDTATYCPASEEELILENKPGTDQNVSFLWSTGSTSETIIVDAAGVYGLTITDTAGCSAFDSTLVTELCETEIYIPDGFTPNGDGLNETLKIFGQNISRFSMEVYNQWGELVFESESVSDEWNGEVSGKIITGTYTIVAIYEGEYLNGLETRTITKDVTVLK